MVSMEKVQQGIAAYVDTDLAQGLDDMSAFTLGIGAALLLEELPAIVEQVASAPGVKFLKLVDDDGNVDVDRLYQVATKQMEKRPDGISVPIMGKRLRLRSDDLDQIYKYIKGE